MLFTLCLREEKYNVQSTTFVSKKHWVEVGSFFDTTLICKKNPKKYKMTYDAHAF